MQSLSDDDRKAVVGEVLADELKAIHELVKDVPEIKKDVKELKADVAEPKGDVKIIKAVVTEHSKQFNDLDRQVTILEAAA